MLHLTLDGALFVERVFSARFCQSHSCTDLVGMEVREEDLHRVYGAFWMVCCGIPAGTQEKHTVREDGVFG